MVNRTQILNSLRFDLKQRSQQVKKKRYSGFFPQIHQQLPLGKRESQQLLNSITASFRKNLDEEHPWQTNHDSAVDGRNKNSKLALKDALASNEARPNRRPTDQHLASILSNPLFTAPKSHPKRRLSNESLPRPNDVFDSAVSKGLMTIQRATGYLAAVEQRVRHSEDPDVFKAMAKYGSGRRVVQWLRASGLENNLEFASEKMFVRKLCGFMFAEGLDQIVWTWLSLLNSRLGALSGDAKTRGKLEIILGAMLSSKAFGPLATEGNPQGVDKSLDDAYSILIRARHTLTLEDAVVKRSLRREWGMLGWESTVNAPMRPKPSVTLFESFVNIGRAWPAIVHLDLAHLDLHHPTSPDHTAAVDYFRHQGHEFDTHGKQREDLSEGTLTRIVSLGVDTIGRLEEIGRNEEANWVNEFMSRTFHEFGRELVA